MTDPAETITFNQMTGAIGSLLLLWSDIERSLAASIQTLSSEDTPKPVRGISRSLDMWSKYLVSADVDRKLQTQLCQRLVEMLKDALVVRNSVCHGLIGISSQIPHRGLEAQLRIELNGVRSTYSWHELQEMYAWMSRSNHLIVALTAAAMESDGLGSDRRLLGWEEFPEQR